MKLIGRVVIRHYRAGRLIGKEKFRNGITVVGKNMLLDTMFHGSTPSTAWYIGLIDNSGYISVSEDDTITSHAGWTEFTDYDESSRPAWTEGAASAKKIQSSSDTVFTISDTGTIKGVFIIDNNIKGGAYGTLWSTALLTATKDVVDDDEFHVTYEVEIV